MSSFLPIPPSQAEQIARCSPTTTDESVAIETAQVAHRIDLVNTWRIPSGSRVLEIGCGQGTCTTVLATAVGPDGHVDAVDPGSPGYGAPYTLAQAQGYISDGQLGGRITWYNADPGSFLAENGSMVWDYAVFSHCIWYFDERQVLQDMLTHLRGRVRSILVAEYALQATERDAHPHVVAAIARAALEAHRPESTANIRCLLSPQGIKEVARAAGWTVGEESVVVPAGGLLDGKWEVGAVMDQGFVDDVERCIESPRVKEMLLAAREAVVAACRALDGRQLRTMDVWVTSLS